MITLIQIFIDEDLREADSKPLLGDIADVIDKHGFANETAPDNFDDKVKTIIAVRYTDPQVDNGFELVKELLEDSSTFVLPIKSEEKDDTSS